ncbi:MAG: phage tail sheath subtilisin-like domain-containing protein [Terracidiphilus sp.]
MGTSLSYPGVYIEELPSGQHTITGVATSIAAFIGWAPQGPVTGPVLVESWPEYQTLFGGLDSRSYLGYAVSQFFGNGGTQAYILRLVANADSGAVAVATTAHNTVNGLSLYASSPGMWANTLSITVTQPTLAGAGITITVSQVTGGRTILLESYANLSVSPTSSQYVVAVIDSDSEYITFVDPLNPSAAIPAPTAPVGTVTASLGSGGGSTAAVDGDVLDPTDAINPGEFTATLFPTSATPASPGYKLLENVEIFNLLCVPAYSSAPNLETLQQYCSLRRAFLIVDPPQTMTEATLAQQQQPLGAGNVAFSGQYLGNAAYYFPWVSAPDPLFGGRPKLSPPCGFVAGIYASTDASRGVWKAPAGINASLSGLLGLQYALSDTQNGNLNPYAINCLRQFATYGEVVWGSRTMAGADIMGSQWKYVPIRRLALYLESSLYDGTQWVVFEPNDETLWGQIRLSVGTFLQGLFLQGAFAGTTPAQAYFVKCDAENNPGSSVALGVVNILVGFAPLYPAEFVVIQIQQIVNQN